MSYVKPEHKKRVSFILPSLNGGGVGRFVLSLCKGFTKNDVQVDLVLASPEGEFFQSVPDDTQLIVLDSNKIKRGTRKLRLIVAIPALFQYFRTYNPDVVFPIWYGADIVIILTARLSRLCKRKTIIIFTLHSNSEHINKVFSSVLRRQLAKISMWLSLRLADKVVAVSNGVAQDVNIKYNFPIEKIAVIYNPLDIEEIHAKANVPFYHKFYNTGIPVILGVGRLDEQKNFPNLVKAFNISRKEVQAKLVILGEGKERKKIESLVKQFSLENDVDLPGFALNPYPYLKNASVFVLSSDHEGLPTVILEALALGTPVVSTNCPYGPSEILENGKYGKLVPVDDPEALASAILDTLKNPLPKHFLQERAKDFSLDAAVWKYLNLIGWSNDLR